MSDLAGCHFVFLNVKATGHVNPTLSIVAELKSRGCQITYFVHEALRGFVEGAGATWRPFRPGNIWALDEAGVARYVPEGTPEDRYNTLPHAQAREAELLLPALLQDLAALRPKPTAIVHDPFISFGGAAAHVLRVPAITTLTMPGPASLAKPKAVQDALESEPWVDGPRRAIIESYGFDIFEHGMPMEFYSPVLNLVTTIDELFMPPAPGHQTERFGSFPFKMVGLLADPSVKRISNADVGLESTAEEVEAEAVVAAVDQARQAGRRVIYISLGTVATSDHFYRKPFGHFGRENGLDNCTGKELAQHIFRSCFEALGYRDDLFVALSLGPQGDVLEGLPALPDNFIARKSLPQLQLLKRCSAFLTHGGANSMHEGLGHGVPMMVVPFFGDQPLNGDAVVRCGAGLNFRLPLQSVTPGAIRAGMDQLLGPAPGQEGAGSYREAARAMAGKLAEAGGAAAAADAMLQASRAWQAAEAHPRLLGSAEPQGKEHRREERQGAQDGVGAVAR